MSRVALLACLVSTLGFGTGEAHPIGAASNGSSAIWLSLALGLAVALYAAGSRAMWARTGNPRPARPLAFVAGMVALFVALVLLEALTATSFADHMIQHVLLVQVAAPLLALGAPARVMAWALPLEWRRRLALGWHGARWAQDAWATLSHPVAAWLLATAALWAWHAPALYQAALTSDALHALEHVILLGTSFLFWHALFGGPRLNAGVGVLSLFLAMLQCTALGAIISFAPRPLYPEYAAAIAHAGGDAITDQQLAGLLMWIPSSVLYLALSAWLFVRWLEEGATPRPAGGG